MRHVTCVLYRSVACGEDLSALTPDRKRLRRVSGLKLEALLSTGLKEGKRRSGRSVELV